MKVEGEGELPVAGPAASGKGELRGRKVEHSLPTEVSTFVREQLSSGEDLDQSLSLAAQFFSQLNGPDRLAVFCQVVRLIQSNPNVATFIFDVVPQPLLDRCCTYSDFHDLLGLNDMISREELGELFNIIPAKVWNWPLSVRCFVAMIHYFSRTPAEKLLPVIDQLPDELCDHLKGSIFVMIKAAIVVPAENLGPILRAIPLEFWAKCRDQAEMCQLLLEGNDWISKQDLAAVCQGIPKTVVAKCTNGSDVSHLVRGAAKLGDGAEIVYKMVPNALWEKCASGVECGLFLSALAEKDRDQTFSWFEVVPQEFWERCRNGSDLAHLVSGLQKLGISRFNIAMERVPPTVLQLYQKGMELGWFFQGLSELSEEHLRVIPAQFWKKAKNTSEVQKVAKTVAAIPIKTFQFLVKIIPDIVWSNAENSYQLSYFSTEVAKLDPQKLQRAVDLLPKQTWQKCSDPSQAHKVLSMACQLEGDSLSAELVAICRDGYEIARAMEVRASYLFPLIPRRIVDKHSSTLLRALPTLGENGEALLSLIPHEVWRVCQNSEDVKPLLEVIATFPLEKLRIVSQLMPARQWQLSPNTSSLSKFSTKLQSIPIEDLQATLEAIPEQLWESCQDWPMVPYLYEMISETPAQQFIATVRYLPGPLWKVCRSKDNLATLFDGVQMRLTNGFDAHTLPELLVEKCRNPGQVLELVDTAMPITRARLTAIVEAIPSRVWEKSRNAQEACCLIRGAKELPLGQLGELFDSLENLQWGEKWAPVLEAMMKQTSSVKIKAHLIVAAEHVQLDTLEQACKFWELTHDISPEHLGGIMREFNSPSREHIYKILSAFSKLSSQMREHLLSKRVKWLQQPRHILSLLTGLIGVSPEQVEVLDSPDAEWTIIGGKAISNLANLSQLASFSVDAWRVLFSEKFSNIWLNVSAHERGAFLQALPVLPADALRKVLDAMLPFSRRQGSFVIQKVFEFVKFYSEEEEAIGQILNITGKCSVRLNSTSELFSYYLRQEEVDDLMRAYLIDRLHVADQHQARYMAALITNELRQLAEEDPLMQEAIRIHILIENPGEKNPYRVYQKLTELAKQPSDIKPPCQMVYGEQARINPIQLQATAELFTLSRKDIPTGVNLEAWESLVQQLTTKVESDHLDVTVLTGRSWETLYTGMLNHAYIKSMLRFKERVLIPQAQFASIFQAILAEGSVVAQGEVFSAQEQMLLKVASGIQHCSSGKREGIALTYAQLNPKFKLKKKVEVTRSGPEAVAELAKEQICSMAQGVLIAQFSGIDSFAQEVTEDKHIKQGVHQSLYLKNLLGSQVGLLHEVIIDLHAETIYNRLLAKSRDEVLNVFYRYFTPEHLVNEVHKQLSEQLALQSDEPNWRLFNSLMALGELGRVDTDEAALERRSTEWEYNEDEIPTRLTEIGALHLLRAIGYIN